MWSGTRGVPLLNGLLGDIRLLVFFTYEANYLYLTHGLLYTWGREII